MNKLPQIWNPQTYWPVWLAAGVGLFLLRELWALCSGRPQDTLSDWVWRHLNITPGESIFRWNAADLLTLCVYVTIFVVWLPWHFWGRKFT